MNYQDESLSITVAKVSPAAAVWGAEIMGIGVSQWIQWLTLLYLVLMISHKAWQMGVESFKYWFGPKECPTCAAKVASEE